VNFLHYDSFLPSPHWKFSHTFDGADKPLLFPLPLRTLAIPERLRGVFTTRRYTNPRLPYLYLPQLRTPDRLYLCVVCYFAEANELDADLINILSI